MTQSPHEIPSPLQLEPETQHFQQMLQEVMVHLGAHLDGLSEMPASGVERELPESLLRDPAPEQGQALAPLLQEFFEEWVPNSFTAAGPGYLAYVPGGGIVQSALADLIANIINRYTGVWSTAPALVQLEANVIRWFCEWIGYPKDSGGFLLSGGSLSNQTALTTARMEKLPEDFLKGTIYTSTQSHHCVMKAAVLAGFPRRNVRTIKTDQAMRVDVAAMRTQLQQDRADGYIPFMVVGNAGTTNTGAIDPLSSLADLAEAEGLWFHIDAAYGGFFVLTQRGKQRLQGIARADSITLDPHKGLFLPYGTGALLVKDVGALRRTHTEHGDYMPELRPEVVDYCTLSPELSRDYRGLRVWLPLKMCGVEAWRHYLDEKLDLAQWLTTQLMTLPHIEMSAPPELSLLAFRFVPSTLTDADAIDTFNKSLMARVNHKQRVILTGTTIDQEGTKAFVIRVCILCFRTHFPRVKAAFEDLQAALQEQLATLV